MNKNIGFIGAGNMTYAIVNGFVSNTDINEQIYVSNRTVDKARHLCDKFGVNYKINNIELVKCSDIIVLAVKPSVYEIVLSEIKSYITKDHIIVSLGAGISIKHIEGYFDIPVKVVRMMSNTTVFVGQGMTALSPNKNIDDEEMEIIIKLFDIIGKVDIISENLMNIVTAIGGSSPAFVYMFIEALADGGVLQGFPRDKAYKYAAQAVLGAAKMVLESEKHPGELKDLVCTPAGTTIEALYSLEKSNFRGTIMEAMSTCTAKAKRLANE